MAKKNKNKSKTHGCGGCVVSKIGTNKNRKPLASTSISSNSKFLFSALAVVVAIVFGHFTNSKGNSNASSLLPTDPWVDVLPNVIPPKTCNDIIYKSERIGYRLFPDSIDKGEPDNFDQQAQEIYIYHKHKVVEPELYKLIQPHLFKLTDAIRQRGNRLKQMESGNKFKFSDGPSFAEPIIEWVFLRKYYPLGRYSKRNSLKVHTDSNMHSITLALNDNYVGGGLFVVRPRVDNESNNTTGSTSDSDNDHDEENHVKHHLHLPMVPKEYGGYRWLHAYEGLTKRHNSSKVFFPELKQGSAALINFTVPHGVAPLAEESPMPRYALIVFYDIDAYYDTIYPLIEEEQLNKYSS